jgi:hypothetical protein
MLSLSIALLLRPIIVFVGFAVVVAPIAWLLYRVFPDGRLKVALFKVRTGSSASKRDKRIMTLAIVAAYVFALVAGFLIWGRGQ